MLRKMLNGEEHLIANDPVRPHIPVTDRVKNGREVYVLENENKEIDAVLCIAYTSDVPTNEKDMEDLLQPDGPVAVAYTVWSYSKGSGRTIINLAREHIKENKNIFRLVTLSPLTEMARTFHLRNGALFLNKHKDCQNFEYEL
jgi:hypothetical protein